MLKICFVSGTPYSAPLDVTTEKKFRALAVLGEFSVIGFSLSMRPRRFDAYAHFYLLPRPPLPILRYAEMFLIGTVLAVWVTCRRGTQIVVAQSPYEGCIAAWAKKVAGWLGRKVAVVVESHGDFEESLFLHRHIALPRAYRFIMRTAAGFAVRRADLFRAVSNATRGQLERWAPGKVTIQFPAWTDIQTFLDTRTNGKAGSSFDIMYAGVLIPGKGIHVLIEAFCRIAEEFPKTRLVIIGRAANPAYAAMLREQARKLGIAERVQFAAELPQRQLSERMAEAQIFVLPSFSEGLPRVVVEAMATGSLVIGSDVGGIPEMIEDGVTGLLVPAGDVAALGERLRWALQHPVETREIRRRAHVFARRFFSTSAYVRGYEQILEKARALL